MNLTQIAEHFLAKAPLIFILSPPAEAGGN